MQSDEQRGSSIEQMHKRRELMEDGRRYIIYYTFGRIDSTGSESVVTTAESGNTEKEGENV